MAPNRGVHHVLLDDGREGLIGPGIVRINRFDRPHDHSGRRLEAAAGRRHAGRHNRPPGIPARRPRSPDSSTTLPSACRNVDCGKASRCPSNPRTVSHNQRVSDAGTASDTTRQAHRRRDDNSFHLVLPSEATIRRSVHQNGGGRHRCFGGHAIAGYPRLHTANRCLSDAARAASNSPIVHDASAHARRRGKRLLDVDLEVAPL